MIADAGLCVQCNRLRPSNPFIIAISSDVPLVSLEDAFSIGACMVVTGLYYQPLCLKNTMLVVCFDIHDGYL